MRNRYPGICYRCGQRVDKGDGHFERYKGKWRTQHASCAIKARQKAPAVGGDTATAAEKDAA